MSKAFWIVTGLLLAAALVVGGLASGIIPLRLLPASPATAPAEPSDDKLLAEIDPAAPTDFSVLRGQVVPVQKLYMTGQPLLVDFHLLNTSDKPVLVKVPFQAVLAKVLGKHLVAGLPLEHIFTRRMQVEGGAARRALVIHPSNDPITELDNNVTYTPAGPIEPIALRPHGVLGRQVNLAEYYPSLRRAGRFNIEWRPYGDAVRSPTVELRIMNEERATIETDQGDINLTFFYDKAPEHVENFLDLARRGFYDGTLFHRIIDDFMIQTGDPLTADATKSDQWGTGRGPRTLRQEFNDTPFTPGVLGAARGDDVNSASCQFFIVTGQQAGHLTGQYTAFGRVADDASLKTALKISKVRTYPRGDRRQDRPVNNVVVKRIRVTPVNPATQPATGPG